MFFKSIEARSVTAAESSYCRGIKTGNECNREEQYKDSG